MPDVDVAPDAPWLPRCETNRVTRLVETPSHAVDPAVTERFVECLWIGDALLAGVFLVKADQQFTRAVVVFLEPLAKQPRRTEKLWLHRTKSSGSALSPATTPDGSSNWPASEWAPRAS